MDSEYSQTEYSQAEYDVQVEVKILQQKVV